MIAGPKTLKESFRPLLLERSDTSLPPWYAACVVSLSEMSCQAEAVRPVYPKIA